MKSFEDQLTDLIAVARHDAMTEVALYEEIGRQMQRHMRSRHELFGAFRSLGQAMAPQPLHATPPPSMPSRGPGMPPPIERRFTGGEEPLPAFIEGRGGRGAFGG